MNLIFKLRRSDSRKLRKAVARLLGVPVRTVDQIFVLADPGNEHPEVECRCRVFEIPLDLQLNFISLVLRLREAEEEAKGELFFSA